MSNQSDQPTTSPRKRHALKDAKHARKLRAWFRKNHRAGNIRHLDSLQVADIATKELGWNITRHQIKFIRRQEGIDFRKDRRAHLKRKAIAKRAIRVLASAPLQPLHPDDEPARRVKVNPVPDNPLDQWDPWGQRTDNGQIGEIARLSRLVNYLFNKLGEPIPSHLA